MKLAEATGTAVYLKTVLKVDDLSRFNKKESDTDLLKIGS